MNNLVMDSNGNIDFTDIGRDDLITMMKSTFTIIDKQNEEILRLRNEHKQMHDNLTNLQNKSTNILNKLRKLGIIIDMKDDE